MTLARLLLPVTQPGYERQVVALSESVEAALGADAFAGVSLQAVPERMAAAFEAPGTDTPAKLQVASALKSFEWWCGLTSSPDIYARMGRFIRSSFETEGRPLRALARPIGPLPSVHNLFVGDLVGPLHSPSRGAVDYARALATLPATRQINIYHGAPIPSAMLSYMGQSLAGASAAIDLQSVNDPGFLSTMVRDERGANHVWCDNPLGVHITMSNQLGPTIMFTCGDTPPMQYADVYWFFREPAYIRSLWTTFGVPQDMIANYVVGDAGPNDDRLQRPARWPRAKLGLREDAVVLVTVGTRLGVDLDETFINGMEATLRTHSRAHWLVVGQLPANLAGACRTVFGPQFSHRPFEPELPSLLTAADVFVNPFRSGGGDSAMRAMTAGAVVLTRGDRGDVAALTPTEHRQLDAETFFDALSALIADPTLRESWAATQAKTCARLADQRRFASNLGVMIDLACDRWNDRVIGRRSPRRSGRAWRGPVERLQA